MANKLTRRSAGNIYQWSPEYGVETIAFANPIINRDNIKCVYRSGQLEDWTTSYVYDLFFTRMGQRRYAYVDCDYVA